MLQEAQIQSTCSALAQVANLSSSERSALIAKLRAKQDVAGLAADLDEGFNADDLSVQAVSAVLLLRKILDIEGVDLSFALNVLLHTPEPTLQAVAKTHYDPLQSLGQRIPNEAFSNWQNFLYEREPTAVISNLVRSGILQLDAQVSAAANTLLEGVLQSGFDILKNPTRDLSNVANLTRLEYEKALPFVQALRRLQAQVTSSKDLTALYNSGLHSAAAISVMPVDSFVQKMCALGMEAEKARQIHNNACTITIRNRQSWALLLSSRTEQLFPALRKEKPRPKQSPAAILDKDDGKPESNLGPVNYVTMFKEKYNFDCTSCQSVLSPAAYLADLLHFLDLQPVDGLETLLGKLLERRPDLREIELSCYNTNTLIPYADIAIEVMESYLCNSYSESTSKDPETQVGAENTNTMGIQSRNFSMYENLLGDISFPMDVFPSNLGLQTLRMLLKAHGTTLKDIQHTFSSAHRLLTEYLPSVIGNDYCEALLRKAEYVLQTVQACEILQMQEEDLICFTHEKFVGLELARELASYTATMDIDTYTAKFVGYSSCAKYWGYQDDTQMLSMTDKSLSSPAEVLERASISYKELVEVLKTNFMARRLIITSKDGCRGIKQDIDDLRLRSSVLVNDNGQLTREVCDDLQIFLRLRRKLILSTADLDIVLTSLSDFKPANASGLSRRTIIELSAVMELRRLVPSIHLEDLCCLWSSICSGGPGHSIYEDLLALPQSMEEELLKPTYIFDSMAQVAALLGIDTIDYEILSEQLGLKSVLRLSLDQISRLYSGSVFCRLIGITMADMSLIMSSLKLDLSSEGLFHGPADVLDILREWAKLKKAIRNTVSTLERLAPATVCPGSPPRKDQFGSKALEIFHQTHTSAVGTSFTNILHILGQMYANIDPRTIDRAAKEVQLAAALAECANLATMASSDEVNTWNGFFFPLAPGLHRLQFETEVLYPSLHISGIPVELSKLEGNLYSASVNIETTSWLPINFNVVPKSVIWSADSSEANELPSALFCHKRLYDALVTLIMVFEGAATLFAEIPLTEDELQATGSALYLSSGSQIESTACKTISLFSEESFNFLRLNGLLQYAELRDSIPKANRAKLLDFMKGTAPSTVSLAELLFQITGWPAAQVQELLDHHYPGIKEDKLYQILQNPAILFKLSIALEYCHKIKIPGVNIDVFYSLAQPLTGANVSSSASRIVDSVLSLNRRGSMSIAEPLKAAAAAVRDDRRKVLLAYITKHVKLKPYKEIRDADSLFEFFLIDVNTGPATMTSRIAQAISTVQLYVQRCFLGLEESFGVLTGDVQSLKKDWSFFGKYTTWEANRKLFLFPENWVIPSLRDNKTEQFKAFESAILKNDLTEANINSAIKNYVYSVNATANLEIEAYLWDRGDKGSGKFYFFARTRSEPYLLFCRSLEIRVFAGERLSYWKPWESIDFDMTTQLVENNGERVSKPGCYLIPALVNGRLFLFAPEIVLKSKPPTYTPGKSLYDLSTDKTTIDNSTMNTGSTVTRYWEIKMAWIEQRDGKWTTRSISVDSVKVDPQDGKDLPKLGSFRFRLRARNRNESLKRKAIQIDSKSDNNTTPQGSGTGSSTIFNIGVDDFLVLDVECWRKNSGNYVSEHLGQFEMRDSQLCCSTYTPAAFEGIAIPKTIPTTFSKLIWGEESKKEAGNSTKTLPPYEIVEHTARLDNKGEEYLLPIQPLLIDVEGDSASGSQDKTLKWTLSFDSTQYSRPLGLVVDVTMPSTGPKTYFGRPPTRELGLQVRSEILTDAVDIVQMHHSFSNSLVSAASMDDGIGKIFRVIKDNAEDAQAFGLYAANIFNESFDANSIYNWELGVHSIMYVVEQLQSTQQFDLALQYARLVFDPTIDGSDMSKCWLFPPFASGSFTASQSTTDLLASLKSSASGRLTFTDLAVSEWRGNPFNAHSIARSRPIAYMKRIVIKYVELLVAAGDVLFRQNSRESLPLALQKYIEAAHVFGPAPQRIDSLAKRPGRSFNQLSKDLDSFSNITLDMELEFPYSSLQRGHGLSDEDKQTSSAHGLPGLLSTTYFCVPQNPDLVNLRALIDDRLSKIRNNQDINGQISATPLFDPPIDPGAMVQAYGAAAAGGGQTAAAFKELTATLGEYRFSVLLQKAYEINSELRSMSELFLAAKEKGDAEELSSLKAQQEKAIATLTLATRNLQKEEAAKTLEVLKDSQKSAESRLKFYLALVGEADKVLPKSGDEWNEIQQFIPVPTKDDLKMTPEEKMEFEKAEETASLGWKSTILDTTASTLMAIPNITTNTQPMGLGASMKIDAENVAKSLMGASTVLKLKSQLASDEGARASRKAQLKRQLQERRLQANIAGRELVNIDKQISAQQTRISMCNSDIKSQEAALQHASSTETWLKGKYTNRQLYVWLESSARMLNFELYSLAIDLARKAERALRFEQGKFDSSNIIDPRGYWNSNQNGLMTAQSLQLALKKLELSSMEHNPAEFEISKTVSLRQLSPTSLIRLRAEGSVQFSLPEVIFDLDFPGHYFRRIRSVALSLPCITGPYTSTSATLSLVEHKCRVNPLASVGTYIDTGRDDRFQTQNVSTRSIAISERSSDSGVFELNFNGSCYMPFEKAGAISTWKLELPTLDLAQFDYSTISDVIIHLKYTARQGGQSLRDAATDAVRQYRQSAEGLQDNEGLFALIDLPNECSDEWRAAVRNPTNADSTEVLLRDARELLPFWAQGRTVTLNTALIALRTDNEESLSGEQEPTQHPGMKVEMSSATKKTWRQLCSSTLFDATIDKKESDKWALFKCNEMGGMTPEQLRLKFTSTATPRDKVDLQTYQQAYLLLRYTVS